MQSFIYPSALLEFATGGLDFMRDDFSVMLLSPSHVPDRTKSVRAELGEEVIAPGYSPAAVETDIVLHEGGPGLSIILGQVEWPSSSIMAGFAAYYRNTGNELSDSLVALIDFGQFVQSINDVFMLTESRINLTLPG